MNTKYYLVLNQDDPGSEHDYWEEAKNALDLHESQYGKVETALILSPENNLLT